VSKLYSSSAIYDTTIHKWSAINYYIRDLEEMKRYSQGANKLNTTLIIEPKDLSRDPGFVGTMTYRELEDYISLLQLQGSDELKLFLIEKHRRFANPFAVFLLTLIGVSLSSKKVRGGIGMNIGIGLILSFHIFYFPVCITILTQRNSGPMLAMWIPNILYSIIALVLYKMAPK